jgi:hypothetical protein
MDFGVRDSTAWVVLAWRRGDKKTYVVESDKQSGLDPTAVGELVTTLTQKYEFTRVIGDLGGMGLAFGVELQNRFQIPIEPAKKVNKRGNISLMNGALERSNLIIVKGQNEKLAKELEELPWKDENHMEIAPGHEDHLFDALLYSFVSSPSFFEREKDTPADKAKQLQLQERELEAHAEEEADRQAGEEWWAQ